MSDVQYANEASALLAKLVAVDADVHFRSLVVREKCAELERTLRYVQTLHERRTKACDARLQEEKCQDAQTQQMHESLQDAIQRARQIREAMTKKDNTAADSGSEEDGDDGAEGEKQADGDDGALQNILAMAKSIRAQTPLDGNTPAARPLATVKLKPNATAAHMSPSETAPASPQIHLEYPRRMKALLDQLSDIDEKESHESFRFVFCRKMAEHLSMSGHFARRQVDERDAVLPPSKVQVGYPKQVARLHHGYRLVAEFMTQRVDVTSEKFQSALHLPTLSAVFPIYARVKQGKQMLKVLNEETKLLVERVPPSPPKLSHAAIAHRDATLKRLVKQTPSGSLSAPAALSNASLLSLSRGTGVDDHRSTLERLQAAWDASQTRDTESTASPKMFETAVKEIVLTDTSNIILSFFKTIFCDNPDDPEPAHVKNMLLLIRLVDSIAMANGRRLRSVVSPIPS